MLPVIHGTGAAITRKIMELGLSNLSTLDAGYYGAGKLAFIIINRRFRPHSISFSAVHQG